MKSPAKTLSPTQDTDDVGTALHLLQETLEDEKDRINEDGAEAMKRGDYSTAKSVIDFAERLSAFQSTVSLLEREWREIDALREESAPAVKEIVSKGFFGKSRKGEITSHFDYYRPLLEVLAAMGGKGKTKEVIDAVGAKMKSTLKPKDYEIHKSKGKPIRWRNSVQWARNSMVNHEGLMKPDSSTGIWEISTKGREWLKIGQKP
jgi:restriction system protein